MGASPCWNLTCRFVLCLWLVAVILTGTARTSAAQSCSTSDAFETNRPDVTNSPVAVSRGSFQAEDGVTWTAENRSDVRRDRDAAEGRRRQLHRVGYPASDLLLLDERTGFFGIQ
jgi:hypothetical protein